MIIQPGDKIFASMTYSISTRIFSAYVIDLSSGDSAKASGMVSGAQRNSVEVGVLSPLNSTNACCVPLAKFSKTSFGTAYTHFAATCYATISGESAPIGSFEGVLKLEMTSVNGNVLRAIPSELTDNNSSFTVSWKNAGP